jgi:hypothetical protein
MITHAAGGLNVPESARALSSLADANYADYFALTTDSSTDATPEQWARAMFGDVPDVGERFIWRGLLGLRLSPGRSPDTVAGWRIGERGNGWIRLEAASWLLSANLVVQAVDRQISLGTFIRYERRLGGRVWRPLSRVHRLLAPRVLRDATTKVRATTP